MSASHANTASVSASPVGFADGISLHAQASRTWSAAREFVADVEVHEVIEGATLLGLATSASVLMMAALGW